MPAASAISCNDVRNPEEAINDAAVARISARRVGKSAVPPARNGWAFAMISGVRIRTTAAWRTYAFVLSKANQIFVRGYQTVHNECAGSKGLPAAAPVLFKPCL